jgi:hypothetical protein
VTDATAETNWINSAVVTEASAARIVERAEAMSYLTVGAAATEHQQSLTSRHGASA